MAEANIPGWINRDSLELVGSADGRDSTKKEEVSDDSEKGLRPISNPDLLDPNDRGDSL